MEFLEFIGVTIDEALIEATIQLETTSDKIEYDIIEHGSDGFLGIGRKPTRIKARKKGGVEEQNSLIKEHLKNNLNVYNIKIMKQMLDNKEPFNTLDKFIRNNQTNEAINYIKEYCNCDESTAKILFVDFKSDHDKIFSSSRNLSPAEIAHNRQVARDWSNKPKCPTCNSTNVEKISFAKKAIGGAMFGLLSSDVRKSMHCKNCGYKW